MVGDKYVITAAHCTDGLSASDIFVQIGDTSLDTDYEAPSMTVGVEEIKQHPDYDLTQYEIEAPISHQIHTHYSSKIIPNICFHIGSDKFG